MKATRICSINGCDRPIVAKGMCDTHYRRWRKSGDPGSPHIGGKRGQCQIQGCGQLHLARGYCGKHYQRWANNGDPMVVKKNRPVYEKPEDHPRWKGSNANYQNVHDRLRAWRGPAKNYECAKCGSNASHWSYDHGDPNERTDDRGCPYSTDLNRYQPLCVSCHWKLDGAVDRLHKWKAANQ